MDRRFNLYSRSEEDKTRDMIMYEKKAEASEICQRFEKIKNRANLVALVSFLLFSAIVSPFFYKAYDSESIVGMILCTASVIIFTILARLATGAILARSLRSYLKLRVLCAKWTDARREMHDYEARFAEQTVFEPDLKRAEKCLIDASETLIAYAKSCGFNC